MQRHNRTYRDRKFQSYPRNSSPRFRQKSYFDSNVREIQSHYPPFGKCGDTNGVLFHDPRPSLSKFRAYVSPTKSHIRYDRQFDRSPSNICAYPESSATNASQYTKFTGFSPPKPPSAPFSPLHFPIVQSNPNPRFAKQCRFSNNNHTRSSRVQLKLNKSLLKNETSSKRGASISTVVDSNRSKNNAKVSRHLMDEKSDKFNIIKLGSLHAGLSSFQSSLVKTSDSLFFDNSLVGTTPVLMNSMAGIEQDCQLDSEALQKCPIDSCDSHFELCADERCNDANLSFGRDQLAAGDGNHIMDGNCEQVDSKSSVISAVPSFTESTGIALDVMVSVSMESNGELDCVPNHVDNHSYIAGENSALPTSSATDLTNRDLIGTTDMSVGNINADDRTDSSPEATSSNGSSGYSADLSVASSDSFEKFDDDAQPPLEKKSGQTLSADVKYSPRMSRVSIALGKSLLGKTRRSQPDANHSDSQRLRNSKVNTSSNIMNGRRKGMVKDRNFRLRNVRRMPSVMCSKNLDELSTSSSSNSPTSRKAKSKLNINCKKVTQSVMQVQKKYQSNKVCLKKELLRGNVNKNHSSKPTFKQKQKIGKIVKKDSPRKEVLKKLKVTKTSPKVSKPKLNSKNQAPAVKNSKKKTYKDMKRIQPAKSLKSKLVNKNSASRVKAVKVAGKGSAKRAKKSNPPSKSQSRVTSKKLLENAKKKKADRPKLKLANKAKIDEFKLCSEPTVSLVKLTPEELMAQIDSTKADPSVPSSSSVVLKVQPKKKPVKRNAIGKSSDKKVLKVKHNHSFKKAQKGIVKKWGTKKQGVTKLSSSAKSDNKNKTKKNVSGQVSSGNKTTSNKSSAESDSGKKAGNNTAKKTGTLSAKVSENSLKKTVSLPNRTTTEASVTNSKIFSKVSVIENKSKKTVLKNVRRPALVAHKSESPKAKKTLVTSPFISIIKRSAITGELLQKKKRRKYFKGGRYRLGMATYPKKKRKVTEQLVSCYQDILKNPIPESAEFEIISEQLCQDSATSVSSDSEKFSHSSESTSPTSQNPLIERLGNVSCGARKSNAGKQNYEKQFAKKSCSKLADSEKIPESPKSSETSLDLAKCNKSSSSDSDESGILKLFDMFNFATSEPVFRTSSNAGSEMMAKKTGLVNKSTALKHPLMTVNSRLRQLKTDGNGSAATKKLQVSDGKSGAKEVSWNLRPSESFFNSQLRSGDITKVVDVLANGANPNHRFKNDRSNSPLHIASSLGLLQVVQLLIQTGSQVESVNDDLRTALMEALEEKRLPVVEYLLLCGAEVNNRDDKGLTPLHIAAKVGDVVAMRLICETSSININHRDDGGWTPLVWACEHGHFDAVRWLLDNGADPNVRDNELNIALHWSAYSGDARSVAAILDKGSNVNAVNKYKDTPLHIASREDHCDCVILLVSRGAETNIRNCNQMIPLLCCPNYLSDASKCLQNREIEALAVEGTTSKFVAFSDISRGKELHPIEVVNDRDNEQFVPDFCYTTTLCESASIQINKIVKSISCCHCIGICSKAKCNCTMLSFKLWYDKNQRLVPDFDMSSPPVIFECGKMCSCTQRCPNRVVQHGIKCHLQLFRCEGKGWGVRALEDLKRGTFICEYLGELLSGQEAEKREDDSYLLDLETDAESSYCVDAKFYGNISRFINHSCAPNLTAVNVFIDHQDLNFPRVALFSNKAIKRHEELCFDYGDSFWHVKSNYFLCLCGASNCKYSSDTISSSFTKYHKKLKKQAKSKRGCS